MDDRGSDVHVHRDRTRADPHGIFNEKFQLNGTFVEVGVTVIYVVSGIAGGLIAGKKMKRKKFLWGLLLGSLYFLILFAVSAALAGGLPKDLVHMGTTLGICMAAGTLGGMMS